MELVLLGLEILKWFVIGLFGLIVFFGNTLPFTLGRIHEPKVKDWRVYPVTYLMIIPRLLAFNFFFLLAFGFIVVYGTGMLFSLVYSKIMFIDFKSVANEVEWMARVGTSSDQVGNAAMNGNIDETTSSWLGKLKTGKLDREPKANEIAFMYVLNIADVFTKHHFTTAIENGEKSPNEVI